MRPRLDGPALLVAGVLLAVSCRQCSPNQVPCEKTSDCAYHHYCSENRFCTEDCRINADCVTGCSCSEFGKCRAVDTNAVCLSPEDAGPKGCVINSECGPGFYCGTEKVCTRDCLFDIDCALGCGCDPIGRCKDLTTMLACGTALDAGVTSDAGVADAGVADAGVADAGVADAGSGDAGSGDAGKADAGDGGM